MKEKKDALEPKPAWFKANESGIPRLAGVLDKTRDGWSPWEYHLVPVYSDDTPWDDPNLDLDEHCIGARPEYFTRYTEQVGDQWITDTVTLRFEDIERNPEPKQIESLLQAKFEIAEASIADLKAHLTSKP